MVSFCVGRKENERENEEEKVNSYWMTYGKEKVMEFERGGSGSPVQGHGNIKMQAKYPFSRCA
jgi:hypothetical protein